MCWVFPRTTLPVLFHCPLKDAFDPCLPKGWPAKTLSGSADAQVNLSLRWAQMHKCDFVGNAVARLIYDNYLHVKTRVNVKDILVARLQP